MNRHRKLRILRNRPDEAWTRRSYAFRGFGLVQTLWLLLAPCSKTHSPCPETGGQAPATGGLQRADKRPHQPAQRAQSLLIKLCGTRTQAPSVWSAR